MKRPQLEPGDLDPLGDLSIEEASIHFGISVDKLTSWGRQELSINQEQRIDPFALCNLISERHLADSPLLRRRWRMYMRWFEPFVLGLPEERKIIWDRYHRAYIPISGSEIKWWLPAVHEDSRQTLHYDRLENCTLENPHPLWHHAEVLETKGDVCVSGQAQVSVQTVHATTFEGRDELSAVYELANDFLEHYRYGYRRHRRDENGFLISTLKPGSCLDAAISFSQLCIDHGLSATLVGGIIAHDVVANPHFWVEVETDRGPMPVDITLPAIARMLNYDWQAWLTAYVGGCDARRITLSKGSSHIPGFGLSDSGLCTGELLVTDHLGHTRDGWPCLDWVCGECSGTFTHELIKKACPS